MLRHIVIWRMSLRLAALLVSFLVAGAPAAQTFPTKPIRVVVGFPAGTSVDVAARVLAPHMQKELGQPVIVEVRSGAAGFLAFNAVMTADPDGHTITFAWPVGLLPSMVKTNAIDARKDLAPISDALSSPYVFMTSATLPVRNMQELAAYAKSKPANTLNFAASAVPIELMMRAIQNATGITYTAVYYQGAPPMITALLTGEAGININTFGPYASFVESGKIRVMFQTGFQKLPQLQDVPTANEAGVSQLHGITTDLGYWAPRGTPKQVTEKIYRSVASAVKQPDVLDMFRKQGYVAVASSPEEQMRQYEATFKFWADAAKAANFTPP